MRFWWTVAGMNQVIVDIVDELVGWGLWGVEVLAGKYKGGGLE